MEGGGKFSGERFTVSLTLSTVIILQLLFCGFFPEIGHPSTPNVPIGSFVYEDIEFLSAVGLLDTAMIGALPLSREEVARLIVEAKLKAAEKMSLTRLEVRVIERLQEEFFEDIDDLKTGNDTVYFKPLREADLTYIYLDQEDSLYGALGTGMPQRVLIEARQKAFTYNLDGLEYRKYNAAARFSFDGRVKLFSFLFEPHIRYRSDPPQDHIVMLNRGYVKFGSKVEIALGQDSKWWGQGRHGSLLLTNNAEPLLFVSLRNTKPIILPILGLFRFDVFLSQLEKERDFQRPEFYGLRFSFKPSPFFEFGIQKTAIFGGSGRPSLNFDDLLRVVFFGKSEEPEEDTSNQVVGIDFRIHFPSLRTDLYAEVGAEDFRDFYPYKYAFIFGAYVADISGFSVRFELFDSNRNRNVWYQNGIYTSGYTFKERVIGHHAGGDAEDFFIEVNREISDHIKLTGSFDLEKRGFNRLSIEEHHQYLGKLRLSLFPYILELVGGSEQVRNPGFIQKDRDNNTIVFLKFKRIF